MKPNEPKNPTTTQAPGSPLADLVDDKLNKSLTEQIAEEIEKKREKPAGSGTSDYASGTVEHDDDPAV